MRNMMRPNRAIAFLLAASLLGGCSLLHKGKPKSTPTIGERIEVLVNESAFAIDPATAATPMTLPAPVANADWGQTGGNSGHALQAVALSAQPAQAWAVSIGAGNEKGERLGGGPAVAGGKVFTVDTSATVRAFDTRNGGLLWSRRFGVEKGNDNSL